jgi:glycerol-3-phosphate acyltransferase PlsY
VLLACNPWLGLATLATWIVVAAFSRYSSLAALVAAVFAPFYQALIWGIEPSFVALVAMSLLLVWRHESNIRKLVAGTEPRFDQRVTPDEAGPAGAEPPAAAQRRAARGRTRH